MQFIDKFLNSITMYRLVVYGLGGLSIMAIIFGFLDILPYTGLQFILSLFLLIGACYAANYSLAFLFKVPANQESDIITALILFLILAPPRAVSDVWVLIAASVIAMASKYLFTIKKKHLFNPAAIAALLIGLAGSVAPVWWVGSGVLLPMVLVLGLLIVRKIRRFPLFFSFLVASLVVLIGFGIKNGVPTLDLLSQALLSWPLIFFATVMLTEPLTMPTTRRMQMVYGVIVGAIFSSQFHVGPIYPTPEFALVMGNIFAYTVSPKQKLKIRLKEKKQISPTMHDFTFTPSEHLDFEPGQYVEWTLPHAAPDGRGNRRYFTLASSPTENVIKLGVRFYDKGSSFKQALLALPTGSELMISQVIGEFTLPKDTSQKLVFIAGGIGVTPFRSMVKYMIDKKEKRDVVLFYACTSDADFVYNDLFQTAEKEIGLKIAYTVSDPRHASPAWKGNTGYITAEMMQREVPDYATRMFYLSGPNIMVETYKKLLRSLGVPRSHIMTDYFPGF